MKELNSPQLIVMRIPVYTGGFREVVFIRAEKKSYQHRRWKAAGQWSQHRRSPPSLQLSQVS